MSNKVIRVLIAKPGLDGHDRGAKVVARGLRDAGYEVIYTGLHQTPEMVVQSAIQEDVDVVGLSILSGAHIPIVNAIQSLMKKEKVLKPIFVGGIIPQDDSKQLIKAGIRAVFGPGATIAEISDKIKSLTNKKSSPVPKKPSTLKKAKRKVKRKIQRKAKKK
ncbi:MAG: cobalamin B12-binding domain-containing protein [Bdellovibrionota bacterium]